LTFNERNCILFRSGEKRILVFLIETAEKMLELSHMSQKEAKKDFNKFKHFDMTMDYFKNVILPILPNSET